MKRLEGKVAWVTGAGTGIGEAAALALAAEGATIVLTGRRREKLEGVAGRIAAKSHIRPGDMTVSTEVEQIAAFIKADLGRLDILVANAGLNILERDWSDLTAAGADALIQGNLSSAFYCSIAALPIMRAQRDGVLIHTASMAGRFIGGLSGAGYTAAKHGVVGLMRAYANNYAKFSIRVNTVHPTGVNTPMVVNDAMQEFLESDPSMSEAMANALPVPMIEAVDISNAIAWLVSDDARYVTGVTLPVDAGFSVKK